MADATWYKETVPASPARRGERLKFLIGGVILLAAIGYLVISGTLGGARYFITVDEVVNNPEYIGETVRISGAVIGETIVYDDQELILDFTIANIPEDVDDLALTLYQAVNDPTATRLHIHLENEVMPDLLTNEAQAIVTGTMGEDGIFYAHELLLKCPSRYEESAPGQAIAEGDGF